MQDDHGAWGDAKRFFRDASLENVRHSPATVRSHDDEVGLPFRGRLGNRLGGLAATARGFAGNSGRNPFPPFLHFSGRPVISERQVKLLTGIQHISVRARRQHVQ